MTKHKDSDARNVSVKVKLLESDANPEAEGLPLIFGRSHTKNLNREWFSSVAYHGKEKQPSFLSILGSEVFSIFQNVRRTIWTR